MKKLLTKRTKTKTRLQYEALECGAASLATILDYFGRYEDLSDLRAACGVNRDGSSAGQILKAARTYGMTAKGFRMDAKSLRENGKYPCIIFWGFNHFLVVEGFQGESVYLSDPAQGRYKVDFEEFSTNYTGIVLQIEPNELFKPDISKRKGPILFTFLPQVLPYTNYLLLLMVLGCSQAFCALFVAGLSSTYIDSFLMNKRLYFGVPIVWLLFLSATTWLLLLAIQFLLLRRIELSLSKKITADLFRNLFQNPYSFFESRLQGELASRLILGMDTTQVIIAQIVRFVIQTWASLLVLIFAFVISPQLAGVFLVIAVGNALLNWALTEMRSDANRKLSIDTGKSFGKSLAGINNMEGLKASGLELEYLSQWQASFGNVIVQRQTLGQQMAWSNVSASTSSFLISILVIAIGGLLIIDGKMTLGALVAFQFLQSELIGPIAELPGITKLFQNLVGDVGRIEDIKNNEDDPLVASFRSGKQAFEGAKNTKLKGDVHIKNLSFSFDAGKTYYMKNLDLHIAPGQQVSLVGGSGSGKSTLMKLVGGLVAPSDGEILFDNESMFKQGVQAVRNNMSLVPQKVFIFNGTIRENLVLWDDSIEHDEIVKAAEDAQILSLILSHKDGFDRVLKDNGSDLSGGERQRLELCRALIRKPNILLLDEATSALDNLTQLKFLKALRKRKITVISIDHRLEASLTSDVVVVMEQGAIVETGAPNDLLSSGGHFSKLHAISINEEASS